MVSLAPPLGCRPPPYRVPYTPHAKCWGASHRPHTCFTMEPLDDAHYIGLTLALARATAPPIHSHFLVAATVVYVDREGAVRHTHGVNAETCVLSSCICAERSALVQLRLSPTGWRYVRAVYITASCEALITPGLLCREFMSEMSEAACAVREAHGAQGPGAGGGGARTCAPDGDINIVLCNAAGAVARHALLELYPHPPPTMACPMRAWRPRGWLPRSAPRRPAPARWRACWAAPLPPLPLPCASRPLPWPRSRTSWMTCTPCTLLQACSLRMAATPWRGSSRR